MLGNLHDDVCTFKMISREFLELKMFQTKVVEEMKTKILCPITLLRISYLV